MNFTKEYCRKLVHLIEMLRISQQDRLSDYEINKLGINLVVLKNVFSPNYFDDSEYFANNLPVVKNLEVLEVGTGTGLIAMKMALLGAKRVIATDLNEAAVRNAKLNVKSQNLESIVEIRKGFIFEPVKGLKFDLIFWNIPFGYIDADLKKSLGLGKKLSDFEKSVFNPYYNYLHEYLRHGFEYLNDQGRLLMGFSPTIGREDILEDEITEMNLVKDILKEDKLVMDGEEEIVQILEFKKLR